MMTLFIVSPTFGHVRYSTGYLKIGTGVRADIQEQALPSPRLSASSHSPSSTCAGKSPLARQLGPVTDLAVAELNCYERPLLVGSPAAPLQNLHFQNLFSRTGPVQCHRIPPARHPGISAQ